MGIRADNQMSKAEYEALVKSGNKKSKYHANKTETDGIVFDSAREARRYSELKILERSGEISNLCMQKKYELIPRQVDDHGKVIEQACCYLADFVYTDKSGNVIVEDVKGNRTKEYIIKRKLMLYIYGIKIVEV